MRQQGSHSPSSASILLIAWCLLGSAWAQTAPPRTYVWSETLILPEGEEIGAPSAVAAGPGPEILVAEGLDRPRLLLFGKQGVSWQLQRVTDLDAVARSLAFDGERWIGSLAGGDGLTAFARSDLSASKLSLPSGLVAGVIATTPRGKLLVADLAGQRIVLLDAAGGIERQAKVDGHITGLAADWSGGFVAAVADEGRIVRFDGNWNPTDSWLLPSDESKPAWPVDLVMDEGGESTVLDRHSGRLLEIDSSGRWIGLGSRRGWEAGLLFLPSGLARLPDGRLVVADEGNGRVQLFRPIETGN